MSSHYGAPPGYAPPPPARARSRRPRWPWVLLAIVVVVVGLFVAVDRVALDLVEGRAAQNLQTSQGLSHEPDVSIDGFPFLTQLASGEFDDVIISARGIEVGGDRHLDIAGVSVHLHHVTVSDSYRTVRARTATATARIDYAAMSRVLGVPTHYGGSGRLVAEPSVTVLGHKFSGSVSAVVHASSGDGITFTDPQVSAAGVTLPDVVTRLLARVFVRPISLAGLPFHVQVTGIDVSASGLVLRLSGRNLVYTRS